MNFWEIILLFFAFQALVYALLLFAKKSKLRQANALWGTFLVLFSFCIFYSVMYWSNGVDKLNVKLAYLYLMPVSLYGPLFFLYVKTLTTGKGLRPKDFLHFIPFLIVLMNFSVFYFSSLERKLEIVYNGGVDSVTWIPKTLFHWGLTASILIYSYMAYREYKKYYTKDFEMSLWLKLISMAFAGFGVFWLIFIILLKLDTLEAHEDYFLTFAMMFFVGLTTYFGFNHSEIFNGKPLKRVFPIIKYEKSGLSKKVLAELRAKLLHLMEVNLLYLDSELKLTDLAEQLNISRHHTSQIINECFQMSFYEFINKYRIEEAERLLIDESENDLNITDIAYKSGFNNRISFYNAFKKYVGITPSEYRNRNLAS
ncbi:helix-turn-helix domain-containing protein [Spongiimicrobium sp. 3-5]|uniref:helix-turn-helix domain-containing protein n=1 Tax=Spongiimicrobium sp. 3-5 TaxID=3332596 RepID=UPI00397EADD8